MVRLTPSAMPARRSTQRCRDLGARTRRRRRLEQRVVDEVGHVVPAPRLREPIELGVQVAPAVAVERRPVGGRRAVEGELLLARARRTRSNSSSRSAVTTIVAQMTSMSARRRPARASPRSSAGSTCSRSDLPGRERMRDEAVGDLARDLDHARPEAAEIDRRRTEGVRPGIEGRDHQRVAIELALEARARPCPSQLRPDRPDRQHHLAHARAGRDHAR